MKLRTYSLILVFIALAACGGGGGSSSDPVQPQPEKVTFSGMGSLGIFDPSVTRDPATGRLWMSYSSVDPSSYDTYNIPTVTYWKVEVRLAYSDDNGTTWQDSGAVVAASNEAIVGPLTAAHPDGDVPASSEGTWQSETSSLIYDPGAAAGEEWKLTWYQYLHADGRSLFADYQWIAMKTASTPQGLAAATPVKLFAGAGLQAANTNSGSPVFAPIGGAPAIQLNTDLTLSVGGADLAELEFCIFAEPGLHATASAVYLSVFCADASTIPITGEVTQYIVNFRCMSPCNMASAANWEYLGRLLSPVDAQNVTSDHHFAASSIVENGGSTYLIVTPVDTTLGDRYNGCKIYKFIDNDSNQLERSNGDLLEMASVGAVNGDTDSHFGACDGLSGMEGGILLSQTGTVGSANTFQVFKTQVSLP